MLSRFDDYPIHQTSEPIRRVATGDRNAYDRYWMNGYDADGGFYFGVGLALYPNLRIMDCAFSLAKDGVQHAFFASRRAPDEPDETVVGPFRIEIAEPMRRLRVVLDDNDSELACDLSFHARSACVQEGRQTLHQGPRAIMDATRFAQFGRWSGELRRGTESVRVDPARTPGTKDRSWGIRPVGEPRSGGAPAPPPQIFFVWSPLHWEDHCTHVGIFEDADGVPWHQDGAIVPAYDDPGKVPGVEDPATETLAGVEHHLVYEPGTRRAREARLVLHRRSGERREIELEPLLRFQMKGLGYTNVEWPHGVYQGELAQGAACWRLDELDPLAFDNVHVQQVMRARCEGRTGVGVMEQLAFGPHARYGFRDLLDGARGRS